MSAGKQPRGPMRLAVVGLVLAGLVAVFSISGASAALDAQAQVAGGPVREAQVLSEEKTGVTSPVGLAFSSTASAFYVVGAQTGAPPETDVVKLTPLDRAGSARLAAAVQDPINMAFDTRRNRLLLLGQASELLEVQAGGGGDLDPATLSRRDIARFALSNPQGMAVDPASGTVFILDAALPRIVRVEPDPAGGFDAAVTSEIDLRPAGLSGARGLAFDSSSGHFQLGSGRTLVELTTAGAVVATRDLSGFALTKTEGMVFAPSGDQTDDPSQLSLYVADSGAAPTGASSPTTSAAPGPRSGQITELSLAAPITTASIDFTSSLVNTVNMGGLIPPSPDPSGITYVPASDRLVVSDGEVEETVNGITHFQGANVWELNRSGVVQRTANISNVPPAVVPVTNEPAGAAFNPTNGHYYFSADDGKEVYDVNPGADGLVGTAGDTIVSFDTLVHGNSDPEGITYDTFSGNLFVADGLNREIYRYTTGGALLGQFDTAQFGVEDPEAVEFNPDSGTLFILSDALNTPTPRPIIVETTTAGVLIRTISAAASNAVKPAGLAYGPASTGSPTVKRFYIVDRGIDNNNDPTAVDGKLYEMSTPAAGAPANLPPVVSAGTDQSVTLPAIANLDGTVSDDNLPAPPSLTTTWSQVSGPGVVTFGNASAVDTTASVPIPGIYVVRLTANDGQFSASDDVTLTFSGSGSAQTLDVRVNAAGDDAEEYAGGIVQKGDGDLDMMTDATGTGNPKVVVGMRFNGLTIPPGAVITSAYVQFQSDEADSVATSLTIKGQDNVNSPTFTTAGFDISSRPTTTASASWSPPAWVGIGDAGLAQRATGLAGIIQEIVSKPGWASGNSLVLLVTGSGERVAVAYNQATIGPTAAPLLHVEFSGSAPGAPQITSYGGGATAAVSAAEGQTSAADVDALDPDVGDTLTYSISGGADQTKFSIVPTTGVVTFTSAPNFESPTDGGGNNVYDVTVSVSDGHGGLDTQAIAVTVLNVNEFPPVISSDGGQATAAVSRPENQTAVTDVDATDADLATPVYAISGGSDAASFAIVPATGVLTFVSAPDFEALGGGGDNIYDVVVEASDGSLSDTQAIAVTVTDVAEGANQPPTVNAGLDQTITLPAGATLAGTVSDDGLPNPPATVTTTWSQVGGVGTATFANANAANTTVTFSQADTYTLRLTAFDGELSPFDELTVIVNPVPTNQPPTVSAGLDQTITLPANATLDGTATDDGLPNPPGTLTTTWSKTSGPGTVTFGNASLVDTTATFSLDGVYVLRLTAFDGAASPFDELTVTVNPATTQSLNIRVSVGADDAEQRTDNTVVLGNAALDMMTNGTEANSVVGTRFRGVTIPPGAIITSAYLQFQAAAVHSVATSLTIKGQAADNAPVFTTVLNDLSSRLTTTASTSWTVAPWLAVDDVLPAQQSPSLTAIIQEIVNRPLWVSGNSLVLLATGSGTRVARSFNVLSGAAAPLLHVEWATGGNQPPSVSAGPDQPVTLPAAATLDGTVSDDGLPAPPSLTTTWSETSGPGTVTFGNASAVDTTATFSQAGTYVLRLTATDSVFSPFDELTVTVMDPPPPGSPLYFSLFDPATVGGVAADNEDVLFFNGTTFSLAFDGTDVGLTTFRIDAFSFIDADSLLLSFDAPGNIAPVGLVDDSDVVRFDATSLGSTTAGVFSMYFQGADVLLTAAGEDVDAVELLPNGHILISTVNAAGVTGVTGADEDLLEFTPTSLGTTTAGTFAMYFDGGDVGLAAADEDVDAAAVDATGKIYLSTLGLFAVTGASGEDDDVFVFTPTTLGLTTTGTFSSTLYFDGSVHGLTANDVFAIDLP